MSHWSLIGSRPQDTYVRAASLLTARLKELALQRELESESYLSLREVVWHLELGSEWGHLLKLCKADRSKAIESICTDLQEKTGAVIDALRKERQSSKSYLSRLPLHIIEDIQCLLSNDMQAMVETWNNRRIRLDLDFHDAAAA